MLLRAKYYIETNRITIKYISHKRHRDASHIFARKAKKLSLPRTWCNLQFLFFFFFTYTHLYSLLKKFENVFPIGILTFARILNDSETRKTADRQTEREITSKRKDETINPCPFSLQFNVLSSFPSNESRRRTRRSNYYTNIFDRIN